MSDKDNQKTQEEQLTNIVDINLARINRLKQFGHLASMLNDFEILRLKLLYDQDLTKQEAIRLVVLTKYFMEYGPTESFRLSCKFLYDKYMKPFNL